MDPKRTTRRRLLKTSSAVAVATPLAGCLGTGDRDTPEDDGEDEDDDRDPDLKINGRYLSDAFPIEFVEPDFGETTGFGDDARLVDIHWHGMENSHWHQGPLEIAGGETRSGRTRFLEAGAEEIPLGPEETFTQQVHTTEDTPDSLFETTVDGTHVDIRAGDGEAGELVFELWADDERRWRSPPLPVEIV
jgi:hypothetical protein